MSTKLTTTFTPPPQCTTEIWRMTTSGGRGQYYGLFGGPGYSSCLPSAYSPGPSFFYSPGFYCPKGYSTACSSTTEIGSETATIATCCPSGFACQTRAPVDAWPWEFTLGCTSACTGSYPVPLRDASTIISNDCFVGGGVNAYSVQLRFRAADFVTTSSIASSTTTPTTAGASRSTPTSGAPTNTGTSSSPAVDGGLTTGAKAGLGVGTVLGVALIAALCWLAWMMRKKSKGKHQQAGYEQAELVGQTYVPKTGHDPKTANSWVPPYTPGQTQYAYNNGEMIHEAQSPPPPVRHELPANR